MEIHGSYSPRELQTYSGIQVDQLLDPDDLNSLLGTLPYLPEQNSAG